MRPEAPGPAGEVLVYEAPGGEVRVEVRLERETVWLTQKQMAALFDTSTDNVGLHLEKIFSEGELAEAATAEDYSVVRIEGRRRVVRRQVTRRSLDAIISVGYRVNFERRPDPAGAPAPRLHAERAAAPAWGVMTPESDRARRACVASCVSHEEGSTWPRISLLTTR